MVSDEAKLRSEAESQSADLRGKLQELSSKYDMESAQNMSLKEKIRSGSKIDLLRSFLTIFLKSLRKSNSRFSTFDFKIKLKIYHIILEY